MASLESTSTTAFGKFMDALSDVNRDNYAVIRYSDLRIIQYYAGI